MTKLSRLTAWSRSHCLFDITNSAYNVLWRSLNNQYSINIHNDHNCEKYLIVTIYSAVKQWSAVLEMFKPSSLFVLPIINFPKEALAIRRIFSLVDIITKAKFSNSPNDFKIRLFG